MNNQEKFSEAELKGRKLFEGLLNQQGITKYKFTKHPMDRIDCVFKNQHHWIAEIKVRYKDYNTLFMEVSKYEAMDRMMLDCGMYVNFIGDKCYIFTLTEIKRYIDDCEKQDKNPKVWRLVNKTTAVDSEKVWKLVYDLPKKYATCYTFKNGIWVK